MRPKYLSFLILLCAMTAASEFGRAAEQENLRPFEKMSTWYSFCGLHTIAGDPMNPRPTTPFGLLLLAQAVQLGQEAQGVHPAFSIETQLSNLQKGQEIVGKYAREALKKAAEAQAAGQGKEQVHQEERAKVWLSPPAMKVWPALRDLAARAATAKAPPAGVARADLCLEIATDYLKNPAWNVDAQWWGLHFCEVASKVAESTPNVDPTPFRERCAQAKKAVAELYGKNFPQWSIDEILDGMWNLGWMMEESKYLLRKCGEAGAPLLAKIAAFESGIYWKRLDVLFQRLHAWEIVGGLIDEAMGKKKVAPATIENARFNLARLKKMVAFFRSQQAPGTSVWHEDHVLAKLDGLLDRMIDTAALGPDLKAFLGAGEQADRYFFAFAGNRTADDVVHYLLGPDGELPAKPLHLPTHYIDTFWGHRCRILGLSDAVATAVSNPGVDIEAAYKALDAEMTYLLEYLAMMGIEMTDAGRARAAAAVDVLQRLRHRFRSWHQVRLTGQDATWWYNLVRESLGQFDRSRDIALITMETGKAKAKKRSFDRASPRKRKLAPARRAPATVAE